MNTPLKRHIIFLMAIFIVIILWGCSTQKNTGASRWWQAFNTRYNTYYNGSQAYIDGSLEKEKGNKDNFTEIIPLYTVGNKNSRELGASNFERAIEKGEKCIHLHSIKKRPQWTKKRRKTQRDIEWLNRREYNPFLWKAWMLLGRSQFMKGDFDEAASTFSYMSRLYSTQPAIYGRARAWLAKCYVEQDWLYDAEDVITKISRDSIHWRAQKEWDYTMADYYIHAQRYEDAIPVLRKVIRHEMRRKQKAREWFLLGQLQEAIGNKNESYKAYRHVIRLNPPYELEFNARIAMTEVLSDNDYKKIIRKLRRMARSDNNQEYLDQVYYAIGNIYLNQKDTLNAISAYEKGNEKSTRNGIEKGVLLLALGDLYWDKEKYYDAQRCYGEAIGLLDTDHKEYKRLSDRSKVLDELVPFTETIHLQDSLQELAKMPEEERLAAIDRVIDALKKKEREERRAQAEAQAQEFLASQGGMDNVSTQTSATTESGTWYFYNPQAVSQGKATFQKQWGRRDNVDDWQRMNRTVVAMDTYGEEEDLTEEMRDSIAAQEAAQDSIKTAMENPENDPHKREYYLKQIPFTEEQVEESNKLIEDGLFHAGVIFKDKLYNLTLSEKSLLRLVDTEAYKSYENMDEAYYHLFLLYSRLHLPTVANSYIIKLKQEFPESKWTILLTDPYFEENSKFGVHIEDSLYAATYNAFNADRFSEVRTNVSLSETRFPLGANRDKFIFIGGLSELNSGDAQGCLDAMEQVVAEYPKSQVSEMAGMIINGVKAGRRLHGGKFDIGDVWSQRSIILNDSDSINAREFIAERNTDFSFLIAYSPDSLNENRLLFELARFNFTNFIVRNFDITIDELNGLHRMIVSGFRSYDETLQYTRELYANASVMAAAKKGVPIIISDKNLELLGTQFSYEDYEKFYETHFVPLRISTVRLLTEPVSVEYEGDIEESKEEESSDGLYQGGVIEEGLFVEDETYADEDTFLTDEEPKEEVPASVEEGEEATETLQEGQEKPSQEQEEEKAQEEKEEQEVEDLGEQEGESLEETPQMKEPSQEATEQEQPIEENEVINPQADDNSYAIEEEPQEEDKGQETLGETLNEEETQEIEDENLYVALEEDSYPIDDEIETPSEETQEEDITPSNGAIESQPQEETEDDGITIDLEDYGSSYDEDTYTIDEDSTPITIGDRQESYNSLEDEEPTIDFNDDFIDSQVGGSNNQDRYELQDEYYDFDGF
ncbi:MAG: hypothetical protein LUC37_05440 [Prevotella sp.]|nr:hypothetical protein [Prevotella sp.]